MEKSLLIERIKDTAQLLALHGANPFQVKHYQQATTQLERLPQAVLDELSRTTPNNIPALNTSTRKLVLEIMNTGTLQRWEMLTAATPQGVRDMLALRGIGPKKVRTLWQDLGIETLAALRQACQENSIAPLPGFGEKTQRMIQERLSFRDQQVGKFHYAEALAEATPLIEQLQQAFPTSLLSLTGAIRRRLPVVDQIEILIGTNDVPIIIQWLDQHATLTKNLPISGPLAWRGQLTAQELRLVVMCCTPASFYHQLMKQTGSKAHLALSINEGKSLGEILQTMPAAHSEEAVYAQAQLPYIPPELREGHIELAWAREQGSPALLAMKDLRGVFHNHTTYSDGEHSLAEMAQHCKELGYDYIGITDHSKQAVYAGGLTIEAVRRQHTEIDQLNQVLAPFKIFKGIEADVLMDGQLDYPDEVLASFDFVIAAIHTGLNMDQEKATARILKAVSHPYTTMLAHPTSRLLLKREGYPINHQAVIDACADHGVIIEINANPWRLELDWQWIAYALKKNVWISINPDAHDKASIQNMYYGVCVGRKGGLTKASTFNALPQEAITAYLQQRKARQSTPR